MKVLTVTNLYPRPDQPRRGLFNAQLFAALAERGVEVTTLVPVPEWRVWKWPTIRKWQDPIVRAEGGRVKAEERVEGGKLKAEAEEGRAGDPSGNAFSFQLSAFSLHPSTLRTRYVPVLHVPVIGRSVAWRFHVRALQRHRALFAECDAVLATWLYPDAVAAGIVARQGGKPYWIKIHGTDRFHMEHPGRSRIINDVVKDAAGLLPNAQFLADYLIEHDVPKKKVHVVRHGVNHERFHPRPREEAVKALTGRGNCPQIDADGRGWGGIVLYVGHIKPIKGPDRLLAAFAQLSIGRAERPRSAAVESRGSRGAERTAERGRSALPILVIVGVGSMRRKLVEQARDLGISNQVHFLGSRPPDEVALWICAAHCLCLPSRSEGMPNVVLEALASGLPVVGTNVGDVSALVRDGVNGFLVPADADTETMASALVKALDHKWNAVKVRGSVSIPTWQESAEQMLRLMALTKG